MKTARLIFTVVIGLGLVLGAAAWAEPPDDREALRIVLDPGHGGEDPGLKGPGGVKEGEFTLALANRFKTALERELQARVVLTRNGDESIKIFDRTTLANAVKADLFISIHAGGRGSGVGGYRIYVQDYRTLAGPAGRSEPLEDMGDRPSEWGLAQAPHRAAAGKLAELLDQALTEVLRGRSRPPLGLPLAVLAGSEQPAVLVEFGDLTNPESERRLRTTGYQDALTRAMVQGIKSWQRWQTESREK